MTFEISRTHTGMSRIVFLALIVSLTLFSGCLEGSNSEKMDDLSADQKTIPVKLLVSILNDGDLELNVEFETKTPTSTDSLQITIEAGDIWRTEIPLEQNGTYSVRTRVESSGVAGILGGGRAGTNWEFDRMDCSAEVAHHSVKVWHSVGASGSAFGIKSVSSC